MRVINGDCIEQMRTLQDNSIDAILTDPPYELGFMGKKWDKSGIAYNVEMWKECLRVLKPGGYLLSFGGTRTYHRMACAIEDAGFEIRDMLEFIFASGFPKSQNIGKMYDKKMGNEREVLKIRVDGNKGGGVKTFDDDNYVWDKPFNETKGTSPYEGLGTATKPAHEPIVCARKPLSEKTVVDNVMKWGTGGIEIDECRIPTARIEPHKTWRTSPSRDGANQYSSFQVGSFGEQSPLGRFPANVLCQDNALNDKGGESRYFDIDIWNQKYGLLQFPKASKRERNRGLEGFEEIEVRGGGRVANGYDLTDKSQIRLKEATGKYGAVKTKKANTHPTVKPLALMRYLVTLVSRRGQIVLDPFAGSGTTLVACKELGRDYIGIELEEEYIPIIKARLR